MKNRLGNALQFLGRFAVYPIVVGFWFAYIGGAAPWIGGLAGLAAAALLCIPVLVAGKRGGRRPNRLADPV